MFSLGQRRMRGHIIEVYKIMRGIDEVDCGKLFHMSGVDKMRGYRFWIRSKHLEGI